MDRAGILRRLLAWSAAAALVVLLSAHVLGLAMGGMPRVIAWAFLVQLLPLAALGWFLPALAWFAWRRRATLPHAIVLVVSFLCLLPAVPGYGLWPLAYPFGSLATEVPDATVRLPTDREMVVGWGGDTLATNYHAIDPAQRWAYDLLIEPAGVGSPDLSAYGCYGVPVLAPAAGRVTVAEGHHPDVVPGERGDLAHLAGNHVAIRLETGTYLVLAHLRPGTVAVSVGDDVVAGQPLGECGNSGNTSEPHVHLHHQRQDPAGLGLLAEGLPLWFGDLEGHEGRHMPLGGVRVDGEAFVFVGERVRHGP